MKIPTANTSPMFEPTSRPVNAIGAGRVSKGQRELVG
ncbi:MAG: hypothetical protein JWM89_222 [Acidimicrobiales bacterium]|nr:hypothetical protein [Acidimicrobiales bacterium]